MVTLHFIPLGADDRPSGEYESAQADEDGAFRVLGPTGEGLPPGRYRIAVYQWDPYPDTDRLEGRFDDEHSQIVRENRRFADRNRSIERVINRVIRRVHTMNITLRVLLVAATVAGLAGTLFAEDEPAVVVAEGENFKPVGDDGWAVLGQEQSYATQIFGGMWCHATARCSARRRKAATPWRCKPLSFPVRAAIAFGANTNRRAVFQLRASHRSVAERPARVRPSLRAHRRRADVQLLRRNHLRPAAQETGVVSVGRGSRRAAEAPRQTVKLEAGQAEIRLVTEENPQPAGNRYVDFVVLTTNPADTCIGWQKHRAGEKPVHVRGPIRSTPIYLRFRNVTGQPVKARLFTHFGHFTWSCAPKTGVEPEAAVPPGAWSPWININQIVELVTDEGLQITLIDPETDVKKARNGRARRRPQRASAGGSRRRRRGPKVARQVERA